jgi:growth factor-regulated tyrosine kinase substrate
LNYSNNNFFILSLAYYESLQDKLSQLKDAREALNALREEHLENKKQQALERERQRQIQLAVKLDDMRQKKQVK